MYSDDDIREVEQLKIDMKIIAEIKFLIAGYLGAARELAETSNMDFPFRRPHIDTLRRLESKMEYDIHAIQTKTELKDIIEDDSTT